MLQNLGAKGEPTHLEPGVWVLLHSLQGAARLNGQVSPPDTAVCELHEQRRASGWFLVVSC